MSAIQFTKMHGIGNDFIVVDGVSNPLPEMNLAQVAKRINDRRRGVGGDGLILITRDPGSTLRMRMLNPDGSEAEMCGNGIRCVAKLARERQLDAGNPIPIETGAGLLQLETLDSDDGCLVRVNMGKARLTKGEIPITGPAAEPAANVAIQVGDQPFVGTGVSMGNPHFVIFVEDVSSVPLEEWGPKIENHGLFPQRTNVHFAQLLDRERIVMRTWERGAGITLACGTGACAVGVAGFITGRTERAVRAALPGGELRIEYLEDGDVCMTGPAETVFEGEWEL